MKPKKLLFVMPYFYGIGGVEKVIQQRLLFLHPHFQILVIESNPNSVLENQNKFPFEVIQFPKKGNKFFQFLSFLANCKKILTSYQPDEVVVLDNGWKGWLFPQFFRGVPINFELHAVLPSTKTKNLHFAFKKYLYQKLMYRFDRVFFLNPSMANEWNHPNKMVISNGIPGINTSFKPKKNYNIIWVGRKSKEKGLENLWNIWQVLAPKYPEWTLKIFTPFKIKDNFFYQWNQKLRMENIIAESNISTIYEQGAIYCNSSLSESFGMSILEAMHFGLAVISFDCENGPRALIDNEINGILIPSFDISAYIQQLELLMIHLEKREELGKKAFEKSKLYNLEQIHQKWLEVYQN